MKSVFRGWLLAGVASSLALAQQALTVEKLQAFLRSSIQMKQPDREVAQYVAHMKLSERLDARTIEELQGEGLGPKTVAALKDLMTGTAAMAAPVVTPPAPKPAPIPPPSYEDQQQIIRDMTDYALNYTKRLPDFVCTQVTRRYADPRGRDSWVSLDTVTAKVSYVEGHENYELKLVNSTPVLEKKSLESVGGSISMGEFGTDMFEIFDPVSGAEFHWEKWTTLRGRRTMVFNYAIEQSRSKYSIEDRTSKARVVTAYKGFVYVDKENNHITRITSEAVDIPATFPVRGASTRIDYEMQTIGTRDFLLPLVSQVLMRGDQFTIKNDIEFRFYRKFGAESTIKFDEIPDPLPDSKTAEQPPPQK